MKIIYLGNFENPFSDTTEKHIKYALEEEGHEVITIDENDFSTEKILSIESPDLFLFHKGGFPDRVDLPDLVELLNRLACKKAYWYFDKVYQDRVVWAESITPFVDYAVLTDESWVRTRNYKNTHILRQGISTQDNELGKKADTVNEIVFTGSIYGERALFVKALKELYGPRFRVVNDAFGRRLYDLAASTKVFVAPKYPQDNFYWSNRIYQILGSGGFLIHPKLDGLADEGFIDGENIVLYRNGRELREKIDYYLEHDDEREKIRKAGHKHVTENYTYSKRVKDFLDIINDKQSSR